MRNIMKIFSCKNFYYERERNISLHFPSGVPLQLLIDYRAFPRAALPAANQQVTSHQQTNCSEQLSLDITIQGTCIAQFRTNSNAHIFSILYGFAVTASSFWGSLTVYSVFQPLCFHQNLQKEIQVEWPELVLQLPWLSSSWQIPKAHGLLANWAAPGSISGKRPKVVSW